MAMGAGQVDPALQAVGIGHEGQGDLRRQGFDGLAGGAGSIARDPRDTAIGTNARVEADGSTAVGTNSAISTAAANSVAVGADSSVTAPSGVALGQGASVTANGAVALGQGSVANQANTVSVGSADNQRRVTNVAAGTAATDAANVGQMQAGDAATLASARGYTDQRMTLLNDDFTRLRSQVDQQFAEVDHRFDQMGAMNAAMVNMATSAAGIRTDNRIGVGVGFQNGASAVSIGYQRALSDRATVTIGGAFSGDDSSVGAGVGFGW